jgi:hypothetical protein
MARNRPTMTQLGIYPSAGSEARVGDRFKFMCEVRGRACRTRAATAWRLTAFLFFAATASFLALSRRPAKCAASAASIFWIRASILTLRAIQRDHSAVGTHHADILSEGDGPPP